METLQNIFQAEIIQRLGWTLVHFVWQATAIVLILAIALKLLHKSSANLRYIIACMALALIVLMPAVTIRMIDLSVETIEPIKQAAVDLPKVGAGAQAVLEMPRVESPSAEVGVMPRISLKDKFIEAVEPALPYIVVGWLVGVFGLSLWHLGGWTQLQRLRCRMVKQVAPCLHHKLEELAQILGVNRVVQLAESALIQVPTVIGWLKPVILLPASALTGLSSEQIEAILAHELAHIKRHDYLVNMLQTVVEILGFYHPAVWWVSRRIRVERENCCDDLAVSVSGDRLRYARALTTMEQIRSARLAVAATGGSLLQRIRRLLGKDSKNGGKLSWLPSVIAILLIAALLIPTAWAMANRLNKDTQPSAVELVRAVRESENWLHRVDSFYARIERVQTKTVGAVEKDRARLALQSPTRRREGLETQLNKEVTYEYAFDKKRVRKFRYERSGRYQLAVWDGSEFIALEKHPSEEEVFVLRPGIQGNFREFMAKDTSWPRSQPHSFWFDKKDTEELMHVWGAEDCFVLKGIKNYRGVECYVLECVRESLPDIKWYVGAKDKLLYGLVTLRDGKKRGEHWCMDYKEVASGCLIPTRQGFERYETDVEGNSYLKFRIEQRVAEVQVNKQLDDKLFELEFGEGEEARARVELGKKLLVFGKACLAYAKEHEGKFPADIEDVRNYVQKGEDFEWIMENVGYLGRKGRPAAYPETAVWTVAYDQTLLERQDGTNILFDSGQVEFKGVEKLKKLGITKPAVQVEGEEESVTNTAFYTTPVTRKMFDTGSRTNCFIDFDKDELYSIPEGFYDWSGSEQEKWKIENGIDAAAETTEGQEGLWGEQIFVLPLPNDAFDRDNPATLLRGLERAKPATLSVMTAIGDLPRTYLFKTHQGGAGLLQILQVQREQQPHYLKIRYKMVPKTAEIEARIISNQKLQDLGKAMVLFEADHNGTLPDSLEGFGLYLRNSKDSEWLKGNLRYVGKGKKRKDRPDTVIAYDKSLLELEQGTNVLFLDAHVEFRGSHQLKSLGIQLSVKPEVQVSQEELAALLRIEDLQKRLVSGKKLSDLGKALLIYTVDHEEKYPETLQNVRAYLRNEQDFQWIIENVEYPGKGKRVTISPQAVIAYDKTLLEKGNGTNVLYNDCHVAFEKTDKLMKLGVIPKEKPAVQVEGQELSFGPVVECVVYDKADAGDYLVDFDRLKLLSLPADFDWNSEKALEWVEENGVDAGGATQQEVRGLIGWDMIVYPMKNTYWEKAEAKILFGEEAWKLSKAGSPVYLTARNGLPQTYMFRTREGGIGILQILGFVEGPSGVEIRYKMVQKPAVQVEVKNGSVKGPWWRISTDDVNTPITVREIKHPEGSVFYKKFTEQYLLELVSKCLGQEITKKVGRESSGDGSSPREVHKSIGFGVPFPFKGIERHKKTVSFQRKWHKLIQQEVYETFGVYMSGGGSGGFEQLIYRTDDRVGTIILYLSPNDSDEDILQIKVMIQEVITSEVKPAVQVEGIWKPYNKAAVEAVDDLVVREKLNQVVDLSALTPQTPFADAIEELKSSVRPPLNIIVLWRDLYENADIDKTTPINIDGIPAIKLSTVLKLLLRSVSGDFADEVGYVVEDGIITIATRSKLPKRLETRLYDSSTLPGRPADYHAR